MSAQDWKDQPFFICGHRKCGTTLLVSLFDGSAATCVFPDDSGFWYGYYPRFDSPAYRDDQKVERLIQVMFHQLRRGVDRLDPPPPALPFDDAEASFRRRMEGRALTPPVMLAEAVFTFQEFFQPGPTDRLVGWMEKTTSSEIYATDIAAWYARAKFIHVLRDPRDNYGSLKSGWADRYRHYNDCPERLLQSLIDRGLLGMRLAALNAARFGADRYTVIRFEDLTAQPEPTVRRLAAFLGIPYEESLLRPTYLGRPWGGNNFEGHRFTGVSDLNVGRWRSRITEHEASVIEFYFEREMVTWGYEPVYSASRRMLAAKEHYKWFNFAQHYSSGGVADPFAPV